MLQLVVGLFLLIVGFIMMIAAILEKGLTPKTKNGQMTEEEKAQKIKQNKKQIIIAGILEMAAGLAFLLAFWFE